MKQEKEFERNRCFMFFESYLESAEKFQKQFGTEVAFDYLVGVAKYALYQEESEDDLVNALISGLKNTIDAGQDKRAQGFNKEDFVQTKLVAEYHRDHPTASQRAIVDALGGAVKKTKVQKTLAKIKESGLSVDEYILNVINPNLNNNLNCNSNSNLNTNSETTTETSRESPLTELVNAQTTAATLPTEEQKENRKGEKRILEDLTDEELVELAKAFKRKVSYIDIQKDFNLSQECTNVNLGKNIKAIQGERIKEVEQLKSLALKEKLKTEFLKHPEKQSKLSGYLECDVDRVIPCLVEIGKNADKVIKFYEDNFDEEGKSTMTQWNWKSKHADVSDTYTGFIKSVMNSNGY